MSDRLTVAHYQATSSDSDEFADGVREGLQRSPKELAPKYLYDQRGSELFEEICKQPEYYPTRTEVEILTTYADQIAKRTGAHELVELGSGAPTKAAILLAALERAGNLNRYVPIDVSQSALKESIDELSESYPRTDIHGVVGDFKHGLEHITEDHSKLVAFFGGTLGNLYPDARHELLTEVADSLGEDDYLLLGTDLVKDPAVIEAAYNDAAGVTAEFTLNVLKVMNRELGANFDLSNFSHSAKFNQDSHRVELELVSNSECVVQIADLDLEVHFSAGERLRTEISTKFTPEILSKEYEQAGLRLVEFYTDPKEYFALSLATPI